MSTNPSITKPDPQRIRRVTESIINLPTLPTVISKMIDVVDNPRTSTASLAGLISTDQTLTARLLKLANSAYYGFPREISTVNQAIVVLGFNAVRDMGLSLSVFDMFKEQGDTGLFDVTRFWEHSVGCGIAARMIAKRSIPALAGEAFVAGLLHDIGKVVFKQYFPAEFRQVMTMVNTDERDLDEAETQVLGVCHAQVGGWLVEKWRLPRTIVEGIANHHAPEEAPTRPEFVAIIALADYVTHSAGVGHSGRKNIVQPSAVTWELLQQSAAHLDVTQLDDLQSEFLLEYDSSGTLISFLHEEIG